MRIQDFNGQIKSLSAEVESSKECLDALIENASGGAFKSAGKIIQDAKYHFSDEYNTLIALDKETNSMANTIDSLSTEFTNMIKCLPKKNKKDQKVVIDSISSIIDKTTQVVANLKANLIIGYTDNLPNDFEKAKILINKLKTGLKYFGEEIGNIENKNFPNFN